MLTHNFTTYTDTSTFNLLSTFRPHINVLLATLQHQSHQQCQTPGNTHCKLTPLPNPGTSIRSTIIHTPHFAPNVFLFAPNSTIHSDVIPPHTSTLITASEHQGTAEQLITNVPSSWPKMPEGHRKLSADLRNYISLYTCQRHSQNPPLATKYTSQPLLYKAYTNPPPPTFQLGSNFQSLHPAALLQLRWFTFASHQPNNGKPTWRRVTPLSHYSLYFASIYNLKWVQTPFKFCFLNNMYRSK